MQTEALRSCNAYHNPVQNNLISYLMSKNVKINVYKTTILPVFQCVKNCL
jgi:hypothetical protein